MKRTKNYLCVFTGVKTNSIEFYTRGLIIDCNDFRKQAKRWIRERGIKDAEERFLLNYLPGSKVIPEESRGLTQGMVFSFQGNLYWDEGYQIISFLEKLIEKGTVHIQCAGKEQS
jgi:Fe-S oxidoreductase